MRILLPLLVASTLTLMPPGARQGGLSDDGRVASVLEIQGFASVRPVGRERWTPLARRGVLLPGDLVRTDARGANAVELSLAGGGSLVLGPGGLVELEKRGEVRLLSGDLEVKPATAPKGTVAASGPGAFAAALTETTWLRATDRKTEKLTQPPRWLTGYRSSTTDEWMGSLVAKIDGRDVPLSVGYHKVDVVIRDQVAQTTVEQSFVNSTGSRLEGVFWFPLPADASIGGFGMWIGNELVEADIVEKQRALAIYEDILQRRKDPALLEWSGGNLFKARVFPIEAHSEKRIRIRYTQVLPLEGTSLRYRYALRSELLRARPLRRLEVAVQVASTMPILAAASTTHEVRARTTPHAATLELSAEEYTPDRDFEVALTLDRGAALTVVPHRRGDDGYFMLLLSPPDAAAGKWSRELVPDGSPLEIVLVADTSGSMDASSREIQARFIASLLAMLGPKDRFRLMTCDLAPRWFAETALPAEPAHAKQALGFLDRYPSMGWTDLDAAFAEAAKVAGKGALVIYAGDGIGTTGDADPVALAQRLRRLGAAAGATFHAVSTSSSYEKPVLEAIASIGGGSARSAAEDPARAALQLLAEAAQPTVKDLAVSFAGLRVARVYPERLPNLPAGTQQVVLGRFLPSGTDQKGGADHKGTITVTGTLSGKPVKYSAELALTAGDEGNSFVPRLWARRHLDALLAEGTAAKVKDEIVAFSEEFGIMTPYTSFLVLENDEDRKQYGVTRRVGMRDGERFFAEGKDQAKTEILREQMKTAGTWRLRLRERMLKEIARLGRDLVGWSVAVGHVRDFSVRDRGEWGAGENLRAAGKKLSSAAGEEVENEVRDERLGESLEVDADARELARDEEAPMNDPERGPEDTVPAPERSAMELLPRGVPAGAPASASSAWSKSKRRGSREMQMHDLDISGFGSAFRIGTEGESDTDFAQWRFPLLPVPAGPQAREPDPDWPREILELLRSLDRRPALAALAGGLALSISAGPVHPKTGAPLDLSRQEALLGAKSWFLRSWSRSSGPVDRWLEGDTLGALDAALRLGRRRQSVATDRDAWPLDLRDSSVFDLVRAYATWTAKIESTDGDVVVVSLVAKAPARHRIELRIDRARRVLLESRVFSDGKPAGTTRMTDFVQAGGLWWARKVAQEDGQGDTSSVWRLDAVRALSVDELAAALRSALATHDDAIFLGPEDPSLDAARQAVHDGKAGFADHLRVALHFAAIQQWEKTWEAWKAAEAKVAGKPGAVWLRAALLVASRKGAELKELLQTLVPGVVESPDPQRRFLSEHLRALAASAFQADEQLALLEALRPASERAGEDLEHRRLTWLRARAHLLANAGRQDDALAVWIRIVAEFPDDAQSVLEHLGYLSSRGDLEELCRRAEQAIARDRWTGSEAAQIFERWTDALWARKRLPECLEVLAKWIARAPETETSHLRHASCLLCLGKEKEHDAWLASVFERGVPAEEDAVGHARLGAAIHLALGNGWNLYTGHLEEKWVQPLAALARALIRGGGSRAYLADRILSHGSFRNTDAFRVLAQDLLADLLADGAIAAMPLDRLTRSLAHVDWARESVDPLAWRAVTDRVRERWRRTRETAERRSLASLVLSLLDVHGEKAEAVEFLRERLAAATEEETPQAASELASRLVREDWTAAIEDELWSLVTRLVSKEPAPNDPADRLRRAIAARAVRWLCDRLLVLRVQSLLGPVQEREKLPRAELTMRTTLARESSRKGLVERLAREAKGAPAFERPWLELERLCFAAELGNDLAAVEAETRELLLSPPAASKDQLDALLAERCSLVLDYAATRSRAPIGIGDRVLAIYEKGMAGAAGAEAEPWRKRAFRLLIALDRPAELEKLLRSWIVPARVEETWHVAFGYLLAETGKLAEAVPLFEGVAAAGVLGAPEYGVLADWHLALGDDRKREQALLDRQRVTPEHQLSNRLYRDFNAVARHGEGVPKDLDPDTLRVLRVLLGKTAHPANYIWQVQQWYGAQKDFRVLESLADGVIGHTPAAVYAFLERCGQVISGVHEEATCDTLAARIAALTAAAASEPDRRALLLLSALVERRASEVQNAPGPHVEKALAHLQAAVRGSWLPGERRLMASFLGSLGRCTDSSLAAEQLRQLEELQRGGKPGSLDRLVIAASLGSTRWAYGRHGAALDVLTAALDEFRQSSGGLLGQEANGASATLVGWLGDRGFFAQAESFVTAERGRQVSRAQRGWYQDLLFRLYVRCLGSGGSTSLGRGEDLYRAARKLMQDSFWKDGADRVESALRSYCELHVAAQKTARIPAAGRDLELFAKKELPEVLSLAPAGSESLVSQVARTLQELRGPLSALTLYVERIEAEPVWFRRIGGDGWRHFGHHMASLRAEAKSLGELEPRLGSIVLRELERDLVALEWRETSFTHEGSGCFWRERSREFAVIARLVIERNPDSPARVLHVARYLWDGLGQKGEGIQLLVAADQRGRLFADGRYLLVTWLHEVRRFKESLAHLDKLLGERPDVFEYSILKVRALHHSGRDSDARALVETAAARRKALGEWNEEAIAALAGVCLECAFLERSVALFEEVIPLHQRTSPLRGVADGVLSSYYSSLADANIRLDRPDRAVEAASAAIVAWGRDQQSRGSALMALRAVVEKIRDLEGFVARHEALVAKNGVDAAVVRKQFGAVYLARGKAQAAAHHLQIALELQGTDRETLHLLIKAHDALGQKEAAARALVAAIRLSPAELDLYKQLADRLSAGKDAEGAERAATWMVEALPHEPDSHLALAVLRERQQRFDEAIEQWRQVVRTKSFEPTGWLSLAKAQAAARHVADARATLDQILGKTWDPKYGGVREQAASLLATLQGAPGK